MSAGRVAAAARQLPSAAGEEAEVIVISDSDEPSVAGPPALNHVRQRRQQQQQRRRPAAGTAAAARGGGGSGGDVIDLTVSSPPAAAAAGAPAADADVQVVHSTVTRVPSRGVKRPRPPPAAAAPQLSPIKQQLLERLRNPPPPPPPEPEPEGPKCGICMEAMGGSNGRPMASGSCGHVYCYDCLVEAVRAQKKCPTCRKGMQQRQIHKVFVNFG